MKINSSDYNYSYANTVGYVLKKPLFKLVSTTAMAFSDYTTDENRAHRIAKIALHCLAAIIVVIPAGLAWLAGKSIMYCSKTQINHQKLSLAPLPIRLPQDQQIDICHISTRYNQLNLPNTRSADQTSLQASLSRLCDRVANEDPTLYPDDPPIKREMFCKSISFYLKFIIKKIEAGAISKDKERDMLMELAEASTRCYPTWLEVAETLFNEINDQPETADVKLLRFVQDHKEAITLEFCQREMDTQWHALNYVRNILGNELGLNTELNTHDIYAGDSDPIFGKKLTKWLFLQKYENANRLISSIHTQIDLKPYDSSYHSFMVEAVKQKGIINAVDYVANHFYDEDEEAGYKLNKAGVNFMLKTIGVLK